MNPIIIYSIIAISLSICLALIMYTIARSKLWTCTAGKCKVDINGTFKSEKECNNKCSKSGTLEQHTCTFKCYSGTEGCYDNSPLYCTGPGSNDVDINLFFPPYECPSANQTMIDIGMIQAVTSAASASTKKYSGNDLTNPFQIKYSVYNLYDPSYLQSLIKAYKAGVYVQVLVNKASLVGPGKFYNKTYETFKSSNLSVQSDKNKDSQRTITDSSEFDKLNLILIDPRGSLMHCKTRYYKFGPKPVTVNIGGTQKNITEAVVTGSFNPECAATKNNEFLIVLSANSTTTPDTIGSYLRIYDYVKRDKNTKFQLTQPPPGDKIYDINQAIYVNYSGWCKNSGGSYMRKIMMDLIDGETTAILIPTYTMSNLDIPDMYKNPVALTGNFVYTPPAIGAYWGILNGVANWKAIANLGYNGIGAQVDINYTMPSDPTGATKTLKCFIRDNVGSSINLIQTGRTYITIADNIHISGITVYETMLTHYGSALNKGVKVILMLDKAEVDGSASFTGGDSTQTAFLMQQMGAILYRCENPQGELHVKNGYFYAQNKLITDTTNWSNAGMGHETISGPNCSEVNSETCLVISGNSLSDKDIFRTRILSNFTNIIRLYAYQQNCGYNESDWKNWGGESDKSGIINYSNCNCPANKSISCINSLCNTQKGSGPHIPMSKGHTCSGGTASKPKYGGSTVNCCLRWGQTQPTVIYTYADIIKILSSFDNWPVFKCLNSSYHLGDIVTNKGGEYIIDPAFNWGKGIHIDDKTLQQCITTDTIDDSNLSPLVGGIGKFCTTHFECGKAGHIPCC